MTVLGPQTLAADFVFLWAPGVGCANAVAGKMTEPANSCSQGCRRANKGRRSLNGGPDSRFTRFFDVIPNPHLSPRISIAEIMYLSIKIVGKAAQDRKPEGFEV